MIESRDPLSTQKTPLSSNGGAERLKGVGGTHGFGDDLEEAVEDEDKDNSVTFIFFPKYVLTQIKEYSQ